MDLIQSPLLGGDAKAILRQALEPYGLAALADIAYAIQQSGVQDIDQIINDLQGTQQFQARFPGLIDPKTGEQVATVAEFVSYEKTLQQQMATYGVTSADIGLPVNELVGNLLQARRSTSEVDQDLQAIAYAKQSPEARRDFYAITGIDPGVHGIAGMILGVAPNLEQAYQQATAAGVDVNAYLTRRYDFENQISAGQVSLAGVQNKLGDLKLQLDPIQAQMGSAQKQLQSLTQARTGLVTQLHTASDTYTTLKARLSSLEFSYNHQNHIGNTAAAQTLQAQIAATKARMSQVLQQAHTLTTSIQGYDTKVKAQQGIITGIQTKLSPYLAQQAPLLGQQTTLQGNLTDYEKQLADLEGHAPTQPVFNLEGGQLSQEQVFEAVKKAQQMHAARFNVGGSGVAQTQPKVAQQTF